MSKNYYALVAGLPDIMAQDKKLLYTSVQMRDIISEEVSEEDMSLVQLLFLPFDHLNIVNALFKKQVSWDERGNLSSEIVEQLKDKKNIESVDLENVPSYIRDFVERYYVEEQEINFYQAEFFPCLTLHI